VTDPPWGKSRGRVVRLVCPCGRTIADVRPMYGQPPPGTPPELRGEHEHEITVVTRYGSLARHGEHPRPGGGITYTWDCRCRKTHQHRDDRLEAAWRQYAEPGRVVRLTLGRDVL
jgi:hypothetical protein